MRPRLQKALRTMAYSDETNDNFQRPMTGRDDPSVTDSEAVKAANSRLITALDALEAAVERRREHDHGEKMLAAQVQALGADRSKLAADLDAQTAHTRRLEATNREIARRLDLAMETIRSVLDADDR
jgi:hypothetical protein